MGRVEQVSLGDAARSIPRLRDADRLTLLGVCPMSEELIRAPIELGMEHGFPVLFVASRNQVSEDPGGGYVMGLDQETFLRRIAAVEEEAAARLAAGRSYLRFVSVDHCGPWYKEREKPLGEREAMRSVKKTLTACVRAGYAGIHIDCSFAPPAHVEMDDAKRIRLTADLFEFCEAERKRLRKPPVSYEIGTEETAGASVTAEHFRQSVAAILGELSERKLPRPAFVVGKTGAKIEMLENVGGFDYGAAASLPAVARELGIGFKEHNADYLSDPILALHPEYGITAANVGPSFAAAQTGALLRLAALEERKVRRGRSRLRERMSAAVLARAPWHKWLRKADHWSADELKSKPAELLAVTHVAGHYVYYEDEIRDATAKLFSNVKKRGLVEDPAAVVMSAVRAAIMRYAGAFNLRGSTSKILGSI
ncbi:MAG: class II D-tagatose-bisphosphate aldolase, non-catalytic subunit [Planctomycetota bacterium]